MRFSGLHAREPMIRAARPARSAHPPCRSAGIRSYAGLDHALWLTPVRPERKYPPI